MRKPETPKRKGACEPDRELGASPTKTLRASDNVKENHPNLLSPSVNLARLRLNSPRQPFGTKNHIAESNMAKRTNLFSPNKLDSEDIENMLFKEPNTQHIAVDDDISFKSPVKRVSRPPPKSPRQSLQVTPVKSLFAKPSPAKPKASPLKAKSPFKVKQSPRESPLKGMSIDALEDLLCSPVKPKTPCPKPSRQSILTSPKANLFKTASPYKISSHTDLEDLLCSPVKGKSPRKQAVPSKSPGKVLECAKLPSRSPRKAATPMKSPRKGAANLFSSPTRESPAVIPTSLCKADVTQVGHGL